jgi:hypothetical protein
MASQVSTTQKHTLPTSIADFDRLFGRMMGNWPFAVNDVASAEPRALRAFEHVPSVE